MKKQLCKTNAIRLSIVCLVITLQSFGSPDVATADWARYCQNIFQPGYSQFKTPNESQAKEALQMDLSELREDFAARVADYYKSHYSPEHPYAVHPRKFSEIPENELGRLRTEMGQVYSATKSDVTKTGKQIRALIDERTKKGLKPPGVVIANVEDFTSVKKAYEPCTYSTSGTPWRKGGDTRKNFEDKANSKTDFVVEWMLSDLAKETGVTILEEELDPQVQEWIATLRAKNSAQKELSNAKTAESDAENALKAPHPTGPGSWAKIEPLFRQRDAAVNTRKASEEAAWKATTTLKNLARYIAARPELREKLNPAIAKLPAYDELSDLEDKYCDQLGQLIDFSKSNSSIFSAPQDLATLDREFEHLHTASNFSKYLGACQTACAMAYENPNSGDERSISVLAGLPNLLTPEWSNNSDPIRLENYHTCFGTSNLAYYYDKKRWEPNAYQFVRCYEDPTAPGSKLSPPCTTDRAAFNAAVGPTKVAAEDESKPHKSNEPKTTEIAAHAGSDGVGQEMPRPLPTEGPRPTQAPFNFQLGL